MPVAHAVLEEIFSLARQAPSNCNVQPCRAYVVSGAKMDQLKHELVSAASSGKPANPDFEWNVKYQGLHRDRQFGSADALYGAMSIERTDKQRRQRSAMCLQNYASYLATGITRTFFSQA